jgi:general secretion pathway protein M
MNVNLQLQERFDRLEPREQKLLLGFGTVLLVMLVLLIPIVLAATTSSRKKENDAMRDVMSAIAAARPQLERQDEVRQRVLARYARTAPPLAGFLEQTASVHSIEIPESQDRPVVPHAAKRYEERSTKIELQKVGMKNLSLFFEALVNSGFPVRISALSIRKRAPDPDSWDASVTLSAFDRKETPATKPAASSDSSQAATP